MLSIIVLNKNLQKNTPSSKVPPKTVKPHDKSVKFNQKTELQFISISSELFYSPHIGSAIK